jgi:hypothetical protein
MVRPSLPLDLVAAAGHRGHQEDQRVVAARRRQRPQRVVVDHLLPPRALRVDNRRLADDGDRLLDGADAKLGVDRDDADARHLDVALDDAEAGEREGYRVGGREELGDAEQSVPISGRGADLLDQHRARGFNSDAREYGARCVADDSGEGGLCRRQRRTQKHGRQNAGGFQTLSHTVFSSDE